MDSTLCAQKKELRQQLRRCRADACVAEPHAALAARDLFLSHFSFPKNSCVAGFLAQGEELDPSSLMEALVQRGHSLCLPIVEAKNQPLLFRTYQAGDPCCLGALQIPEPLSNAACVVPDVLLVPLLGFDRKGYRLGQGGGFYDRTLAGLRSQKKITAIGFGYAAQEVPCLPVGPHDALLDAIVTEREVVGPFLSS